MLLALFVSFFTVSFGISLTNQRPKVLVLGGTGFVGRNFIAQLRKSSPDAEIISISRRGKLPSEQDDSVSWIEGDASSPELLLKVVAERGPFSACVHSIGLLLDTESGLSTFNKFVSGSSSIPGTESTYDKVTRATAFCAIDALETQDNQCAFAFVSAAEVGWTIKTPVNWLNRYLDAKKAVEQRIETSSSLRGVVFRPSLIWTWDRPQALLSVLPFYIGHQVGLPFVDKPVMVETLVKAMVAAIGDPGVRGIKRYDDIEVLGGEKPCR